MISLEEIQQHNDSQRYNFWVVIESYVLDLSAFLKHHPGSERKILQKREKLGVDITQNFVDHFRHTVDTFRQAARKMENKSDGQPLSFQFREVPGVDVTILGKLESNSSDPSS